jgi:tritrans,polycis-undecaprenyl-diphosphate synthase [geranylgeranyl-diphosphate specific]
MRKKNKKPSLKSIAGKKIDKLHQYAIQSDTGKKVLTKIYKSEMLNFFSKKIDSFKDYKLIEDIKNNPIPNHVAIIMDGNRRFAENFKLIPEAGHILGSDKIEDVLDWCFELHIKCLTVYAFSTENFTRDQKEVSTLMNLCKDELDKAVQDPRVHENKVRIRVLGHIDSLPEETKKSAEHAMNCTQQYDDYFFNIALAYGGREEIIRAIQQIACDVKDGKLNVENISQKTVSSRLYTNGLPDPDLILRTSGEERISNFLLWQLAYSELYFSDVFWPAFEKRDFLKAIRSYQERKRRFGK